MRSVDDIISFIESDDWIMNLLRAVGHLNEADCWLAAGGIRNSIWAKLHGVQFDAPDENDVDVVFYDKSDCSRSKETSYENYLGSLVPMVKWEVRNQARMHLKNTDDPYRDCFNALEHWPDTPTAIGARLHLNQVEILAPFGIEDLVGLVVRQTPKFIQKRQIYEKRIEEKNWRKKWPLLTII